MKLLTPTGYKEISNVNIGDELIAYDVNTGQEIINTLLSKEVVTPNTYAKTDKWLDSVLINNEFRIENITTLLINGVEDKAFSICIGNTINYEGQDILVESIENIPAGESHTQDVLTAYVINGTWTLCKYQSIWVNNNIVKHAPQLQIGDIIFDGFDKDVQITSIEEVVINDWIRLEVSGDHSYIADNLTLHNASRFWVGGTGNWDASTTTNWSSTSGGGGGSSVPTSADDVTFDNLSNATLYTCTVTANANCANLTLNAPASGALTFAGNAATRIVNIYGNYSMAATNVTISYGGQFALSATSGTKTITSNGNNFVSSCLTFTGVGCTFQFADDLAWSGNVSTSFGQLRYVAGTIDPNGKTVSFTGVTVQMTGNLTFYNLTRTGTTSKTCNLIISDDITITNTFTCNGNSSTSRMWVLGNNATTNSIGTQRTITSAINSITNSDFQDIKGAGAASWDLSAITGLSGDCGGNSGITFTTAAAQTATGTASFNWDTAAIWTSRVPLPQDDVTVNNAFVAGRTVTMNMPRAGKTITFGCTGSPTVSITTNNNIYGGLDLSGVGTLSTSTNAIGFLGRSSYNINMNGLSYGSGTFIIESVSGTYTLTNNLTTGGAFQLRQGTFNAATYNVTLASFNSNYQVTRTLTIGSGTWELTSTSTITIWNVAGSNFSTTGTGTIKISGSTANIRTFAGGGFTYPTLWFTNATASGQLSITGSNTFAVLKCNDSNTQSIKFTAGTTQTLSAASGFQIIGASGNLITLDTITGASTFTLSCSGNNAVGKFISLSRCTATGGARWFAQNSTNNTGNYGWRFAQSSNRQMSGIGSPTLIV